MLCKSYANVMQKVVLLPAGVERAKTLFGNIVIESENSAHSTHQSPLYPVLDAFFAAPPDIFTRVHLHCTALRRFSWSNSIFLVKTLPNGEI